jgi:hypothetical protein
MRLPQPSWLHLLGPLASSSGKEALAGSGAVAVEAALLSRAQSSRADLCAPFDPASSAILAHIILQEKLNMFGMLGCLLCITGSLTIVLHAPPERHLGSVIEVFQLAMQPGAPEGLRRVPLPAIRCTQS